MSQLISIWLGSFIIRRKILPDTEDMHRYNIVRSMAKTTTYKSQCGPSTKPLDSSLMGFLMPLFISVHSKKFVKEFKIPYLPYIFGQTGLSKQFRPRWDATECGVSSVSTLFATHPAIFIDTTSGSQLYWFKFYDIYGKELRCPNT